MCYFTSFLLIFSFFGKSIVIQLRKFTQLADLDKMIVVCLAKKQKNQGKLIAKKAETYFSYQECPSASFLLIFSLFATSIVIRLTEIHQFAALETINIVCKQKIRKIKEACSRKIPKLIFHIKSVDTLLFYLFLFFSENP